jgi:hypothetical protein
MARTITGRHEIEQVLADPGFEVAPVPPGADGLAWLRASVSRFVNGTEHADRRERVEAELRALDPAELRSASHDRARRSLEAAPVRRTPRRTRRR